MSGWNISPANKNLLFMEQNAGAGSIFICRRPYFAAIDTAQQYGIVLLNFHKKHSAILCNIPIDKGPGKKYTTINENVLVRFRKKEGNVLVIL